MKADVNPQRGKHTLVNNMDQFCILQIGSGRSLEDLMVTEPEINRRRFQQFLYFSDPV